MTKAEKVTQILLSKNQYEDDYWYGLLKKGISPTKNLANKFMLTCILDYQMRSELVMENARRLAEDILGDPNDLWERITSVSEDEWMSKRKQYALHRFPAAHKRVWRIGREIVANYRGDARNIWLDRTPLEVVNGLLKIGAGEQISRMIAGSLCDTEQIIGSGDVKVDIHVRRILGRVFTGTEYSQSEANVVIEMTRNMHSENPWMLDKPLYQLGSKICSRSDPKCSDCYLSIYCEYYTHSLSG